MVVGVGVIYWLIQCLQREIQVYFNQMEQGHGKKNHFNLDTLTKLPIMLLLVC